MYPTLLILLYLFAFSDQHSNTESGHADIHVLHNQLERYIIDYENKNNESALWLIYLVIKSAEDGEESFNRIIKNNKSTYSKAFSILDCINSNFDDNNFDFLFRYVLCSNNYSLKLSHLYNIRYDNAIDNNLYNELITSINPNELSHKELFHYNFLLNDDKHFDYNFDSNNPHILDYYFSEYILASNLDKYNDDLFLNNFKSSITNFNSIDDINDVILFIIYINTLYKFEQEYEIYKLSQVLNNHSDLPISYEVLKILNYISFSAYLNGFYQYDIDIYRNALIPLSKLLSQESHLKVNIDYGVSLYRIGNTVASLDIFENIYNKRGIIDDPRYYSALLNNLGISYLNIGYFERYIQLQLEALQFSEKNEDITQQIFFLKNLYIYHRRIQNWNTAIEFLEKAKDIALNADNETAMAELELAFGTFHRDYKKDHITSLNHLYESKKLAEKTDYYEILVTSLIELAETYKELNDFENSYDYFKEASKHAINRNDDLIYAYTYYQIANLFF